MRTRLIGIVLLAALTATVGVLVPTAAAGAAPQPRFGVPVPAGEALVLVSARTRVPSRPLDGFSSRWELAAHDDNRTVVAPSVGRANSVGGCFVVIYHGDHWVTTYGPLSNIPQDLLDHPTGSDIPILAGTPIGEVGGDCGSKTRDVAEFTISREFGRVPDDTYDFGRWELDANIQTDEACLRSTLVATDQICAGDLLSSDGSVSGRGSTPLTDIDGDGLGDLCVVDTEAPTGSGRPELHCADASTNFATYNMHRALPMSFFGATGSVDRERVVMGDVDGDSLADLCTVFTRAPTGSGAMELHCAGASSGFRSYNVHAALPIAFRDATGIADRERIAMGDVDGDAIVDLCVIYARAPSTTGRIEIHCADGSTNFSTYNVHQLVSHPYIDSPFSGGGVEFVLQDLDEDGWADLCMIYTMAPSGSGRMELHCTSGRFSFSQFNMHAALPFAYIADTDNRELLMTDVDGDERGDLCIVHTSGPTGSGRAEVHCVSAASNFHDFNVHAALPMPHFDLTRRMVAGAPS